MIGHFLRRARQQLRRHLENARLPDAITNNIMGTRASGGMELESLSEMNKDLQAREQMIQIRVIDAPRAGVSAANQGSDNVARSIALGGGFGLGLGLAIAFFSEFFCRRVRFKSDVVNDAELEVVGVIPEK